MSLIREAWVRPAVSGAGSEDGPQREEPQSQPGAKSATANPGHHVPPEAPDSTGREQAAPGGEAGAPGEARAPELQAGALAAVSRRVTPHGPAQGHSPQTRLSGPLCNAHPSERHYRTHPQEP